MKYTKYFVQFLLTILCFFIFKIIGANLSSNLSGKLFEIIGPFFRSKQLIHSNIKRGITNINSKDLENITRLMWNNYGRLFAEYMFIKNFRTSKLKPYLQIEGKEIFEELKKKMNK